MQHPTSSWWQKLHFLLDQYLKCVMNIRPFARKIHSMPQKRLNSSYSPELDNYAVIEYIYCCSFCGEFKSHAKTPSLALKSALFWRSPSNRNEDFHTVIITFFSPFSSSLKHKDALRSTANWILNNYLLSWRVYEKWHMAWKVFSNYFDIKNLIFVYAFIIISLDQLFTNWQKDKTLLTQNGVVIFYHFTFSSWLKKIEV